MRLRSRPLPLAAAVLALLLAAVLPAAAVSPPVPATPPAHVVDLAGVVDDAVEARLDALLRDLERQTTAQVLVLTVRSLEGESLEAFSIDVAHNRWKLGQKGKDNGILITLALQERRYRIEVGYGLEAVLPDSAVGSIGRDLLVPAFRAGDYGGGLAAAAAAIAERVAAAAGVRLAAPPAGGLEPRRAAPQPRELSLPQKVIGAIIAILLLILFFRHPELFIMLLLSGGRRGGGGWGGGGGGFGGGGGGGFGGGGASGSW